MSRQTDVVQTSNDRDTKINFFREYYNLRLNITTSELEATAILNMSSLLNLDMSVTRSEQPPIDITRYSHNNDAKTNFMKDHYHSRLKTTTNEQEAAAILNMSSLMNLHIEDDDIERESN